MKQNFLIYKIGQEKLSFAKQITENRYSTDTLQVLSWYQIRKITFFICQYMHQSSNYRTLVFQLFCRFNIYRHFIAVHVYRKQIQQYSFIFNTKTNNCPYNCCEAKKDIGTIDLQVTYDQHVITATPKAIVRLVHNNSQMEAQFLRALHVAS